MGLLHHGITILNFDGSYIAQDRLCHDFPHNWIDLYNIKHTNLYCEENSFNQIKNAIKTRTQKGITLIGNGNYHYVSYALLSEIQEPFTLILLDHHTDLMEGSIPSILSCGSWVYHSALNLPYLQKAIIIGPDTSNPFNLPTQLKKKIHIISNEHFTPTLMKEILLQIQTDLVYISIDKDILDSLYAETNWDQGHMALTDLIQMMISIITHKHVCGIDICGEWPVSPEDAFCPKKQAIIYKNEQANRKILEALLDSKCCDHVPLQI
ncbi:arginase family enzyme [Scopulibacillus daqui]|uniref:Arginase family enzyme n=1 Tax=Scopulibacillus daqui TaxID=1469162 RepID=A0ABS2Q0Z1_9BACL|nr:arginase family protein [Scopulibacillus daqui]MBM7645962.1 arginase family enzyme [Scopulibacillus daqui]